MPQDETPFDAVDAGKAVAGDNTATGKAAQDRQGTLPEESHEDQTLSETAEAVKPDAIAQKANPLIGQQKEEARFLPNGSLPAGVVASNSGFVPASAVTHSPEEAKQRIQETIDSISIGLVNTSSRQRLTDEKIASMGGAELRAVAHDRGYDINDAMGTRAVRGAFTRAQTEDTSLDK